MPTQLYLLADTALPPEALAACRELGSSLCTVANTSLMLAYLDGETLNEFRARIRGVAQPGLSERLDPRGTVSAAPMSAAPFVYRDDGLPDWGAMWQTFCDLALYGGPPHRGDDSALTQESGDADASEDFDAISEIRRGIFETTGLESQVGESGWMEIRCVSRKMAAWLSAAIILENVEARCEGDRLLLPAQPGFRLTEEVKSVVTVVAKTHHYWTAHTQVQEALAKRPSA